MEGNPMKGRKKACFRFCGVLLFFLIIMGCVSAGKLEMPKPLPSNIRLYKHFTLYGNRAGMQDTELQLYHGELFTIIATGSIDNWPRAPAGYEYHAVKPELGWPLMARIEQGRYFKPLVIGTNSATVDAPRSGRLFLGHRDGPIDRNGNPENPEFYRDNLGSFSVDIIVWKKEDWIQIADVLSEMKEKNSKTNALDNAVRVANALKEFQLSRRETTEAIEQTKKQIETLSEKPKAQEERVVQKSPEDRPVSQGESPIGKPSKMEPSGGAGVKLSNESEKEARIAQLEKKLEELTATLAQLEVMKDKFEEEKQKSLQLTEELEEKARREQELVSQLKEGSKNPPVIVIASPRDEATVEINIINLSGVVEDEGGVGRVEIFINGRPLKKKDDDRGIMATVRKNPKRFDFLEHIRLEKGTNRIKIRAVDTDGLTSEKILTVSHIEKQKNLWAVVIGINDYPKIRKLRYAVNDARIVSDHLVTYNHVPSENLTLLLNKDATLTNIRSALGTHLKNSAGKDDLVIVFFAGHGATEKDMMSPDGDGLEKYLLPYDADPNDLYATALPMSEISRIFNRIRSERLVFIVDSCYSGASGGRTIEISGIRANISETFLDRITSGKGRVILSASGANEVSAEDNTLEHGVFTYYLVEGLRGKADFDGDGLITVDEVYRYVSERVPQATGQEQHPIKKGTVEGNLILGVIE